MNVLRHERVNCLNGLLILEHDLTVMFKEGQLSNKIYGTPDLEVYRQRTDLIPYTIALHWTQGDIKQFSKHEEGFEMLNKMFRSTTSNDIVFLLIRGVQRIHDSFSNILLFEQ